ncbi:MAG: hypothetical protein KJ043_10035, partial [Anaerolineae bacterium]|nr:hypothetical protein [Anaerolineae bacterium]
MSTEKPSSPKPTQASRPPKRPSPPPPQRGRYSGLTGVQIMFSAIIAIGLILAINFSSRITSSRPLN